MITLDTSAIVALGDRRQAHHEHVTRALEADPGPFIVPAGILAEATYMIDARLGQGPLDAFLEGLIEGAFTVDCGEEDLPRIRALVHRYADLPLGFADAAVIACAERHGGRVLTLDRRDFTVVAKDARLILLPD